MGESTQQLEWNLAAERRNLGRNLQELEDKAQSLKDWRTYFRQHPNAVIAAAFGGALIVGFLSRRSPRPTMVEYRDSDTDSQRYVSSGVAQQLATSVDLMKRQAATTWDHIADTLMGIAAAKAIDFVSERIPGFGDEYSRRHG